MLSEWYRYAGWSSTRKVAEVAGSTDELRARLRPWALEIITGERLADGEYFASLVTLDEDGYFDTYLSLHTEDVFWFYEQEFVPAQ